MNRPQEMQGATSAPACTSTKGNMMMWQGTHTFHYHHHYFHYEWPSGENGPMRVGHAGPAAATVCCCAAMNSARPHDFISHEGPPIKCPVNISGAAPAPATRREFCIASPVSTRQSRRFTKQEAQPERDPPVDASLYAAVEASPLTLPIKAGRPLPLKNCSSGPLPPFPALPHALPYILCQYCSRLLLLPPSALLLPPPGTPFLESALYVKLKCGFCLNLSKFSTRHLLRASSSTPAAEGVFSPLPIPSPLPLQSMPSCITSNGVMQEASKLINGETEEPIDGKLEPALEFNTVNSEGFINGNAEHNSEHEHLETCTHLNLSCNQISNQDQFNTSEPANGTHGESTDSKVVVTLALANGKFLHTEESFNETEEPFNGTCGNLVKFNSVETGALLDCECAHAQEIAYETVEPNSMCGEVTQALRIETGALVNGECACTEEISVKTVEKVNGMCTDEAPFEQAGVDAFVNGNCGQTYTDNENEAGLNGIGVDTTLQKETEIEVHDNGGVFNSRAIHSLHPDKEEEITAYSSVQDWVDSLSLEIGYESDAQFQTPSNGPSNFVDDSSKSTSGASTQQRSRLHQHLGYSSPSELFEKVLFSEDEEIKVRTESSSTATSSSFSSMNACQPAGAKSPCKHVHAPSLRSWDVDADHTGVVGSNGQDAQKSLAGLLRKGLKVGSLLPASPKTRVVVNGRTLSSAAVKQAEERAGKLRPGSYWYDCKAGFWGAEGGPCLGILPPYIEELNYPMAKQCSNGDTQVYVNGRELHAKDLTVLSHRGLSQKAGRAYVLGFDGVLVDESTGLELKQLGKLAPTVEKRGKGFGMFTAANALQQSKAPLVHQIKPANRSY